MVTKHQKVGIAAIVAGGIAIYFATRRAPTTYHYIPLPSSINEVLYDGATISAAKAAIKGDVIIWWQDPETGEWLFYDTTFPPGSTLAYVEYGKVYRINLLTVWPQEWKVPDYKDV